MKHSLFPTGFLVAVLAVLPAASGFTASLSNEYLEGNAEKRARLAGIEGKPAPELSDVSDWKNSKPLSLASLKGKIVVLDFWATWCGPCLASIPHNNEIAEKYADDGVVFIAVTAERGADKTDAVIADKGIKYPVVTDTGGKANAAYEVNGFPDYFIIDREGNIAGADVRNNKVEEAIQELLKQSPR